MNSEKKSPRPAVSRWSDQTDGPPPASPAAGLRAFFEDLVLNNIAEKKKEKNDPINKSADQGSEEDGFPTATKIESNDIPSEKALKFNWKAVDNQKAIKTKTKKLAQVLTPRGDRR